MNESLLDIVRRTGASHGLNLVAAVPIERYDAAVKPESRAAAIDAGARSIIVVGNGGGDFWRAFRRHAERNPGWMSRENPLDDFSAEVAEHELVAPLRNAGARATVIYPFMNSGPTLNFVELGRVAGLGGPSIIGVLINPEFGPWIAFRAAILVDHLIDEPGAAAGYDPCPRCATRSCIAACPAEAVSFPAGWDIPRCLEYRVTREPDCAPRCHARAGCVVAPAHRYPDDELAYHQMRALRAMRPYYLARTGR